LRLDYTIGKYGRSDIARLQYPNLRWGGYNAVRFWLKPDNSHRIMTFFFMEKIRDGTKWFWQSRYLLDGTEPRMVILPFSGFTSTRDHPPIKRLDTSVIEEIAMWFYPGEGGNGQGTVYVDDLEVAYLPELGPPTAPTPGPRPRPARLPSDRPTRILAGATEAYIDRIGQRWVPDSPYTDGEITKTAHLTSTGIDGATDAQVYLSEREGLGQYEFPVHNGRYTVKLHFAETRKEFNQPGKRVFSVYVNDTLIPHLDITAEAGKPNKALVKTVGLVVKDKTIRLRFAAERNLAKVNAIEIIPARSH
jgi:hypothetical protein